MSPAAWEVLRTGGKGPFHRLWPLAVHPASTATLWGWSASEERGRGRGGDPGGVGLRVQVAAGGGPMWRLLLKSLTSGRATPARRPLSRCPPPACLTQSSSAVLFHLSKVLPVSPASSRARCETGWPGPVSARLLGPPPPCASSHLCPHSLLHSLVRSSTSAFGATCSTVLSGRGAAVLGRQVPRGPRREGQETSVCTSVSAFSLLPVRRVVGRHVSWGWGGLVLRFCGVGGGEVNPPPWVPPELAPRGALRRRLGSKELIHTTGHPETRVRKL